MLSDSQIDRYARQIVLPEIGGRGQEQLLAARVAIRGGCDAAVVAASYLAGAGVGALEMDELGHGGAVARALGFGRGEPSAAIAARNPDCRLASELGSPTVVLEVGARIPDELPADSAVFWGAADETALVRVHFPPGTACAACLKAASLLPGAVDGASAIVLGSLLAVDALRVLLGLADETRPSVLLLATSGGVTSSAPFPARADCPRCNRN